MTCMSHLTTLSTVLPTIFAAYLNLIVPCYCYQVFFNDLILLDIETMIGSRVNAVESHLPAPVSNSSLSIVGNKCFVFGGTDVKGNCFNDIRSVDISYYLSKNDITVGEGASSDYTFKILIIGDACNIFSIETFSFLPYFLLSNSMLLNFAKRLENRRFCLGFQIILSTLIRTQPWVSILVAE